MLPVTFGVRRRGAVGKHRSLYGRYGENLSPTMLSLQRHCHISTHTQKTTTNQCIKYIVVLVFTRGARATSPQMCKPGRISQAIADHHFGELHPTKTNKALYPQSSVLLHITPFIVHLIQS